MRKWILAGIVLVAIIAAVTVAVINLNSYLNANKVWLAERVEASLGRHVEFSQIGVSLAGGLGVRVEDVAIDDDPAFSDGAVVRADSALVRIRLWPALFGRYEVARVVLEQPIVEVVRTEAGLNLATLGEAKTGDEGSDRAGTAAFVISTLDIENGSLRYADLTVTPPTRLSVESIDFSASDIRTDAPVSFRLAAAALGSAQQNVRAKGVVGPPPRGEGDEFPLDVTVEIEDLSTDNLARIPEIAAKLPSELATSGAVSLTAKVVGVLSAADVDLALVADDAQVRYGNLLDKPADVPLRVELRARQQGETVHLETARFLLRDAEVRAKGIVGSGDTGGFNLALTSDAIGLAGWDRIIPALAGRVLDGAVTLNVGVASDAGAKAPSLSGTIGLRDVSVQGPGIPAITRLTTDIALKGNRARVEPTTFSLGGAPAQVSVDVSDLGAPAATFKLSSDALPLAALEAQPSATSPQGDILRSLAVEGSVVGSEAGVVMKARATSSAGTLRGITFQNLAADVRLDGNRVVLEPLTLAAFGGTLRGTGVYDMTDPASPGFDIDTKVQSVRLGEVIAAFTTDAARVIEGNFDADLALEGAGNDWATISQVLAGKGRISLRDGALKDLNLVDGVLQGMTGIPGLSSLLAPELRQKYPRLFATADTTFDSLEGLFQIANGKLITDDLAIRAADFVVNGSAGLGFDRGVDVKAVLALSQQLSRDLVASVGIVEHLSDEQGRVRIPFLLDGRLPTARPRPDVELVAHSLQRAAVDGFVDGIINRARKRGETPAGTDPDKAAAAQPGAKGTTDGAEPKEPSPQDRALRGLDKLLGR